VLGKYAHHLDSAPGAKGFLDLSREPAVVGFALIANLGAPRDMERAESAPCRGRLRLHRDAHRERGAQQQKPLLRRANATILADPTQLLPADLLKLEDQPPPGWPSI
jgi:hypothetical protein